MILSLKFYIPLTIRCYHHTRTPFVISYALRVIWCLTCCLMPYMLSYAFMLSYDLHSILYTQCIIFCLTCYLTPNVISYAVRVILCLTCYLAHYVLSYALRVILCLKCYLMNYVSNALYIPGVMSTKYIYLGVIGNL